MPSLATLSRPAVDVLSLILATIAKFVVSRWQNDFLGVERKAISTNFIA
jgi:hypothetical protein